MTSDFRVQVEFSIWLASKTRWAHLTKTIPMSAVPRVGDFVKFTNSEQGDYFAWPVTQVTYHESGSIEVWTGLLDDVDARGGTRSTRSSNSTSTSSRTSPRAGTATAFVATRCSSAAKI